MPSGVRTFDYDVPTTPRPPPPNRLNLQLVEFRGDAYHRVRSYGVSSRAAAVTGAESRRVSLVLESYVISKGEYSKTIEYEVGAGDHRHYDALARAFNLGSYVAHGLILSGVSPATATTNAAAAAATCTYRRHCSPPSVPSPSSGTTVVITTTVTMQLIYITRDEGPMWCLAYVGVSFARVQLEASMEVTTSLVVRGLALLALLWVSWY